MILNLPPTLLHERNAGAFQRGPLAIARPCPNNIGSVTSVELPASTDAAPTASARRLAEAGCSTHEIAAITGHASLKEVARCTEAADRKRLAQSAMAKIRTLSGKPDDKPDERFAKKS